MDVIDINVFETTEQVTFNVTEQLIEVNVNKVTGGNETLAQTLVFGNNTGGTNILLNDTDSILLENGSYLKKGTYDFGANGGISLVCGVGFENMWQGGIKHVFDGNGFIRNSSNGFNIIPDFNFDSTLRFKVGSIWTLDDLTNYICTDATEGAAVWELYNVIPSTDNLVPYTGATQDVNLGEFGLQTGNIEFDNTPTNVPTESGSMYWNDIDGTTDLILKGGNVKLQIGQESVIRVVNKTATNINLLESNYQAVRVTGAQGQRLKVDLAQATTDNLSAETIGLVTETINNNQEGFVTTSGLVRSINTTGSLQGETWNDGDILYLSPTVAGRITNVKPIAPNHLVIIGYVVYAHDNNGSIFVKVDNGYELDELHNVRITTPLNNQGLVYNSTTEIWENKTIIQDAIVDGVTAVAPSQNAVFDALANKQDGLGFTPPQTWQSGLNGTLVANTLTITPTYSRLILANSLAAGDVLDVMARASSSATKTALSNIYIYVNTSNDLSGTPLQLAIYTSSASTRMIQLERRYSVKGTITRCYNPSISSQTDIGIFTSNLTNLNIDWTIDQYIIIAIGHTLASTSENMTGDFYRITKN